MKLTKWGAKILLEICTFLRILLRGLNIGQHLAVIECCQKRVDGLKAKGKWQQG